MSSFGEQEAGRYDQIIGRIVPGYQALLELTHAVLRAELAAQAHILAAGCGTGTELVTLARNQPGWQLTGCDVSAAMIRRAREKVEQAGLADRVSLVRGSVAQLKGSFDAATLLLVLHFLPFPEQQQLLSSLGQCLKPGAPLVLASATGSNPPAAEVMASWQAWMGSHGASPAWIKQYLEWAVPRLQFVAPSTLQEQLLQAGFQPPRRIFQGLVFQGFLTHRT